MADETLLATGSMEQSWPARLPVPLPTHDARSFALAQLKRYVASIVFRRPMAPGEPARGFKVPVDQIFTYQPDDLVDAKVPSIAFLPGMGDHEIVGLGPAAVDESSGGRYGPGTWLIRLGEYTEQFTIEVLAAKHAIRRAMVAGLVATLRGGQASSALNLKLPDYYDQVATFTLGSSEYVDDPEVAKNRRRARIGCSLVVPEVRLINGAELNAVADLGGSLTSHVLDGSVYLDLEGTPFDPDALRRGACFRRP